MKAPFIIFAALIANCFVIGGCESNNDKVRNKVRETVNSITSKAILDATADLDRRNFETEGTLIAVDTLPSSFAAFEPVEVHFRSRGSYLIVTEKWVQHKSGLLIAAPDEVVPDSTKHVIHQKIGDRLYFYQD